MIAFSSRHLGELMETRGEPRVSMYMPMQVAGPETRQNPIRFKNALSTARERLAELALRPPQIDALCGAAERLLDEQSFWQHQQEGLAAFLAPDFFRHYSVPARFDELVVVGERFHLKPAIALLAADARFFVLALSQKRVRLLDCVRDGCVDVTPADMPAGLEDALKYDLQEAQLQFHTGTPQGPGDRAAVYHGQGVGTDDHKDRILRYCRAVDVSLHDVLRERDAPLVLAGVEYLFPIYRQANRYAHLLEDGVAGNPDERAPAELRDKAWALVEPRLAAAHARDAELYGQQKGTGLSTATLEEIVPAAAHGRVACLFFARGVRVWGGFDEQSGALTRHQEPQAGSEDLVDLAAVHTLAKGGRVRPMEPDAVPDGGPAAAILRY